MQTARARSPLTVFSAQYSRTSTTIITVAVRGMVLATGLLFAFGPPLPGYAQSAAEGGSISNKNPPGGTTTAAKPRAAKPVLRSTNSQSLDMRMPQTPQWRLEDAMPSRTRTYEPATTSNPGLGRLPVQGGSFGLSTETKSDAYRTPDGSRIRGLESSSKSDPSYIGLSLSVTTDDKSFLPRTVLPTW